MFLAYNASISDDPVKVIQRWMTGREQHGRLQRTCRPLPWSTTERMQIFRFVHDKVVRLDLGNKPLVSLKWGMYLFVPSIKALNHYIASEPESDTENYQGSRKSRWASESLHRCRTTMTGVQSSKTSPPRIRVRQPGGRRSHPVPVVVC